MARRTDDENGDGIGQCWLAKSEPSVYSIDDLRRDGSTLWDGIRNYQARNFLRSMQVNDRVLFHHSSGDPTGVVGTAVVVGLAQPDPTQFDPRSEGFDEASKREDPRWCAVTVRFGSRLAVPVTMAMLRADRSLKGMRILQRGNRLSVMPVTAAEFARVLKLGGS